MNSPSCLRATRPGAVLFAALLSLPGASLARAEPSAAPESLPPIDVTAPSEATNASASTAGSPVAAAPPSGRAEDGYREAKVDMGPLGEVNPLNTPHDVETIPAALMTNAGALNLADVLKFVPSAQIEARGGIDIGRPQTRGFQGDVIQNTRIDGMSAFAVIPYPTESFQRIDVLSGLAGGLYGPASPAGTFNYVFKRPTDTQLIEIGEGYTSDGNFIERADVGGREGGFGYRVFGLHGSGRNWVEGSSRRRDLVGGAFDFHVTDHTVLEINASRYIDMMRGFPGGFAYAPTVALPSAVDPTKVGYGQSYAGQNIYVNTASGRLLSDLGDGWKLTLGALHQNATRNLFNVTNTLSANSKTITQTLSTMQSGVTDVNSGLGRLEGVFNLGGFSHEVFVGFDGYNMTQNPYLFTRTYKLGSFPYDDPTTLAPPNWLTTGPTYKSGENRSASLLFGDTLHFNDQWSALAHFAFSRLSGENYSATGAETSSYDNVGLSPTLSMVYKPTEVTTAYLTYADSLHQGDTAPSSGVKNPNVTLAPYRSNQWELGFKADVWAQQMSIAGFRIERPFAYAGTDGVFRTQGEQVNWGVDINDRGRVTEDITVVGGVTWLDPRMTQTALAATSGKLVVGVPQFQANLYGEYTVPRTDGLVLSANVHYTGRRAANDTNTTWAADYATLDLGARKSFEVQFVKVTARLGVNNVFDARYWASIFPSSTNGGNAGTFTAYSGAPRTVWASLTADF